jgi:hypothetical protein
MFGVDARSSQKVDHVHGVVRSQHRYLLVMAALGSGSLWMVCVQARFTTVEEEAREQILVRIHHSQFARNG